MKQIIQMFDGATAEDDCNTFLKTLEGEQTALVTPIWNVTDSEFNYMVQYTGTPEP